MKKKYVLFPDDKYLIANLTSDNDININDQMTEEYINGRQMLNLYNGH